MDKADDYLRDAAECFHLAARHASIEHRARLLEMAEAWIYLADHLRKKWPVCGPQITSSMTGRHKKQQGKPSSRDKRSTRAAQSEQTSLPARRELSTAFLLQLEEPICAAEYRDLESRQFHRPLTGKVGTRKARPLLTG